MGKIGFRDLRRVHAADDVFLASVAEIIQGQIDALTPVCEHAYQTFL